MVPFKYLLILACLCHCTSCDDLSWEFVYWEAPPFVYSAPDKTVIGIIPHMYEYIQKNCQIAPPFVPKANVQNYTYFGQLLINQDIRKNYTGYPMLEKANGSKAGWVPLLHKSKDYLYYGKEVWRSELLNTDGIAVFARRDMISFSYKVYQGLKTSTVLFLVASLFTIFVSIFIWFFESHGKNEEINSAFTSGAFKSVWLSVTTLTTGGYGDVSAKSVPGRVLSVGWMMFSLIIASLLTGTVHDSFTKTRYLNVMYDTVAVLRGSEVAYLMVKNWKATIKEFDNHEQVLDAVRYGDTVLGVMNTASAGHYQTIMNQDDDKPKMSVVEMLDLEVPVGILLHVIVVPPAKRESDCFLREMNQGLLDGLRKYRRKLNVEKVYYPPIGDMFKDLNFWTYCAIAGAILMLIGFVVDLAYVSRKGGDCSVRVEKGWKLWRERAGIVAYVSKKGGLPSCRTAQESTLDSTSDVSNSKSRSLEECQKEFTDLMEEVGDIKKEMGVLAEKFNPPLGNANNNFIIQSHSISY